YQVVDVLMLVACVAPISIYFLTLGLVNSHARPHLVSSRSDFLSLTVVLIPLLVWPLPLFVHSGLGWLYAAGLLALALLFIRLLPPVNAGFVIYNISEKRAHRLLQESIRHLGWAGHWQNRSWNERSWRADDRRMSIHIRGFALLRNVTFHIEPTTEDNTPRIAELQSEIERRFTAISQLPSPMGACLVLLGAGLLIIPMWMVSRHIDDLVDAMSHLFG
ncbi:MAG: hypothetical protein ACE5EQ_12455, partial [Phycisphaerae bacterium]